MSFFEDNNKQNKSVLLLGSGGLRIGQAGEFDYSGSQAIKALKEENIRIILVNPNIATVQTEPDNVDKLYLQPLNLDTVTKIIEQEKPDGLMLGFGGQTALNLGLELDQAGVLEKFNITVLGSSIETIKLTEDRELFKTALEKINIKSPKSFCVTNTEDAIQAAESIGYPIMMRSGFTLGGLGSGKINNQQELILKTQEALISAPHILVEEYLFGWKEFEYEIVRDIEDNVLTICNMENLDPMGVHTGESIVVAPSQTLSNTEYHHLRTMALKIAREFKILGECNIQYAVNPKNGDYRVIEMNARLSRSSALASKATGYPLAFIATKLALHYPLYKIKNSITQKTCAFFEPALDYIVVKIPRWDSNKLRNSDRRIGTEMKSVGEVMSIGRSFPEALQKAVGMLNIGASGLTDYPYEIKHPKDEVEFPTDRRIFALYKFFEQGGTVEQANELSQINRWFLEQIYRIYDLDKLLKNNHPDKNLNKKLLTKELLTQAKLLGFSDSALAKRYHTTEVEVRAQRLNWGITPVVKQIDSLAGEFDAQTNYLYLTYHGDSHDIAPAEKPPVIVLGSGPYSIGSSVEFDWCAVTTSRALRELNKISILINSNPETVSTDYDESDRLYFEQLSAERVKDIADFENPHGIIISVGGQVANNLAMPLYKANYPILGTDPVSIDKAENRKTFSAMLSHLEIDQPAWDEITSLDKAKTFANTVGYPVLIRPSYVLSGAAMNVVYDEHQLEDYLNEASMASPEHPVVISDFITNAKELEIDGVANQGEVVVEAITEHIENAGVHSGDATIVLPPQEVTNDITIQIKKVARQVIKALNITGPFNIQFIVKNNRVGVIECNVRASRSFPFVSKVTNHHFMKTATKIMMGCAEFVVAETLELDYVAVKAPQFSYQRLKGVDPVAHVEMASTGEVAVIADNFIEAFFSAWQAADQKIKGKRILISINSNVNQLKLLSSIKRLSKLGYMFYSTKATHGFLLKNNIDPLFLYDAREGLKRKSIDLVINLPSSGRLLKDGEFGIRRQAVERNIPLITNVQIAELMLYALFNLEGKKQKTVSSIRKLVKPKEKSLLGAI